jgi:hypothetical protein
VNGTNVELVPWEIPDHLAKSALLVAVQHIRPMRGGSQAQMMLASDDNLYVVKFRNNPQGKRVLMNDLLASRLARMIGLSVPPVEIIEVEPWLIETTPELSIRFQSSSEPCEAGPQFASRLAGGLLPGRMFDYLPEPQLTETINILEFAGMLVFDKWTCNSDGRQAVFVRQFPKKRYSAVFIDQGNCFNGTSWKFVDLTLRGMYPRHLVYAHVTGWSSLSPWLERVESLSAEAIHQQFASIPKAWNSGEAWEVDRLIDNLIMRRGIVRELITDFRKSDRNPFPLWKD